MKILYHILHISIGILIMFILNFSEHTLMPVIKNFEISNIERLDSNVYASGWMRKTRDCSLVGITAEGKDFNNDTHEIKIIFSDSHLIKYPIPIGKHTWGPWTIVLPVDESIKSVEITATHSCHPAWNTSTKLIELDIKNSYLDF